MKLITLFGTIGLLISICILNRIYLHVYWIYWTLKILVAHMCDPCLRVSYTCGAFYVEIGSIHVKFNRSENPLQNYTQNIILMISQIGFRLEQTCVRLLAIDLNLYPFQLKLDYFKTTWWISPRLRFYLVRILLTVSKWVVLSEFLFGTLLW